MDRLAGSGQGIKKKKIFLRGMGGVAAESGNSIGLKVVFPSVRFFDYGGRRFERFFSFFSFSFALLANCLQDLFNGWSLHVCMWAWRVESMEWMDGINIM